MALRNLSRKTKMQLVPTEEDVSKLLFNHTRTQSACRLFLDWMKERGNCTRSQLIDMADLQTLE